MKKLVALSLAGLLACAPFTAFADDEPGEKQPFSAAGVT